jgi:hypothetical protein
VSQGVNYIIAREGMVLTPSLQEVRKSSDDRTYDRPLRRLGSLHLSALREIVFHRRRSGPSRFSVSLGYTTFLYFHFPPPPAPSSSRLTEQFIFAQAEGRGGGQRRRRQQSPPTPHLFALQSVSSALRSLLRCAGRKRPGSWSPWPVITGDTTSARIAEKHSPDKATGTAMPSFVAGTVSSPQFYYVPTA